MNKKIKAVSLVFLLFITVGAVYYLYSAEKAFYKGRTTYLSGASPVKVTIDSKGRPWVAEPIRSGVGWGGYVLKVLEKDNWVSFTIQSSGLCGARISSLASDHAGNLWIGMGNGSCLLMFNGKDWTTFTNINSGLVGNNIEKVAVDSLDRLWIAYEYSSTVPAFGVTMFDGTDWTTYTTDNSGLGSNEVSVISFDSENRVWLGTTAGINVFDGKKWLLYTASNSGLKEGNISSIAFDVQGRVWVGTSGKTADGINMLDGTEWNFYSPADMGFPRNGNGYYWSLPEIVIDKSQRVWVLSGNVVRVFDGKNWLGFIEEDGNDNFIFSIAGDQNGNMWMANGNDRGLVVIDPKYSLFASSAYIQYLRMFVSSGGIWFVAVILISLFLAIFSDSIFTIYVILGEILGFIGFSVASGSSGLLFNPGTYAIIGTFLGACIDTVIHRFKISGYSSRLFTVIGFVVGLVIGLCFMLIGLFIQFFVD